MPRAHILGGRGGTTEDGNAPPETSAVPIPPAQIEQAIAALDDIIESMQQRTQVPGLAVAVVRDGMTVYAKGVGVRSTESELPVTADTVFQLASVSKSVGATVVAHQVGKSRITWDTPIQQYLPWFRLNDEWVSKHVTLGDLYSHRSGLPDHAGDELEDLGYSRQEVLERLHELPLQPFRASYAYTNFGLTAAAEAVAAAAGMDWAALSEAVLYRPLGMTGTSSRHVDFEARANRAWGHVKVEGGFKPLYQRRPDAQSPAGGVSSSAHDMARWMALVLNNGRANGREITPSNALLPAISPQMVTSPPSNARSRASFYGYGFNVGVDAAGRTFLSHSGAFLLGASTAFTLVPAAGVGIIVLTNSSPTGAAEAIATEFAERVTLGQPTRDWLDAYSALMGALYEPLGALAHKLPPQEPDPALPAHEYIGTYVNAYFGAAQVEQHRGQLVLTLGPARLEYPLQHWDGNVFVFEPHGENAPPGSRLKASFQPNETGAIHALHLEHFEVHGLGTFKRK